MMTVKDEDGAKFDSKLSDLPLNEQYEKSFMHKDEVAFVNFTKNSDFLITTSYKGHVKFWKKNKDSVEFVKHFLVHTDVVTDTCVCENGNYFATVSKDKSVKIFDVGNFDLINMFDIDFTPKCAIYVNDDSSNLLIAISNSDSGEIFIFNPYSSKDNLVSRFDKIHKKSVTCMVYSGKFGLVVSADETGAIEYWSVKDGAFPDNKLKFKFKTGTNLFNLIKDKTFPLCMSLSSKNDIFGVFCGNWKIYIFHLLTGKLVRTFDESVDLTLENFKKDAANTQMDHIEFGKKVSVERDLIKLSNISTSSNDQNTNVRNCLTFDESSRHVIYTSIYGIKVKNLKSQQTVFVIGGKEKLRFLNVTLFLAGHSRKKDILAVEQILKSENSTHNKTNTSKSEPSIVATAYNSNRFYIFTSKGPNTDDLSEQSAGENTTETVQSRDILNEKPTIEVIKELTDKKVDLPDTAVIHTRLGDISIKLYKNECPKAVENFFVHGKNGYYNNHLFHRVIKNFMVQTGDPKGDGTGGESIYENDFEDEFHPRLRHNQPFVVSMANSGPNTNGSQFFITVIPTPWLDDKHTLFGKVFQGASIVRQISELPTNPSTDRPLSDIFISSISFK